MVETENDNCNTRIHDRSFFLFDTGTSIQSGGVKPVIGVQTSVLSTMMPSWKCVLQVSKMLSFNYITTCHTNTLSGLTIIKLAQ